MLKKLQSQNFGQNPAIKSQPNFSLNIYFWKVLSPFTEQCLYYCPGNKGEDVLRFDPSPQYTLIR